jgi:hypothetical protein
MLGRAIHCKSFPTVLLGGFPLLSLTQKEINTKHQKNKTTKQETGNQKPETIVSANFPIDKKCMKAAKKTTFEI